MEVASPRVLVVASYFPERSQTFVLDQVSALQEAGFAVEVLARTRGDGDFLERQGQLPPVIYADLPRLLPDRLRWAAKHVPAWLARDPRATWQMIDPRRVGPEGPRMRAFADLVALPTPRHYDVIYCHFGQAGLIGARLRALGRISGQLVVVFHGSDVSTYLAEQGDDAYDGLRDQVALAMPVSDHWRHRLLELGFHDEQVRVHHMGIDPARFTFASRGHREGSVRMLSLGRLVEKKAIADALRALQAVPAGAVTYTIAGDGPELPRLRELADELRGAHEIRFLGAVDPSTVADLHASHDVFVAPSVTGADGNKEGIPVAIMEAMASGMPVISTWHSGIPELVEDGVGGILVQEHDIAGLGSAMRRFADDRELLERFGRNAREAVVMGFNQQRLNVELVGTLRSLAGHDR